MMRRTLLRTTCVLVLLASGAQALGQAALALQAENRVLSENFADRNRRTATGRTWDASTNVEWIDNNGGRVPRFAQENASIHFPGGSGDQTPWLPLRDGTIRLRFRPDWNSGDGPGHYASFFSVGVWTPDPARIGYWALTTNPQGTHITFSGQRVGQGTTFLSAPIRFVAGSWYEVALVYSANASRLLINGDVVGQGKGVSHMPSSQVFNEYGLHLGNNHTGRQAIGGTISHLEAYRSPASGFRQQREAYALRAVTSESPAQVALTWHSRPNEEVAVKRRVLGTLDWTNLAVSLEANSFIDRDPRLGSQVRYEYAVGQRRIVVSIGRLEPVESPGRVLLVVAKDLGKRIAGTLNRFQLDLVGDGWNVTMVVVSPHSNGRRSRYRKGVAEVKTQIQHFYRQAPGAHNLVLLIGNVPIPYSGFHAEDGHVKVGDDHRGAWPCDAYYADLDGVWTDSKVDHKNRSHDLNSNRPGDGRFDQDYLPSPLELAVSRIDFSGLPAISGETLPGKPTRPSRIEAALTERYFEKNRKYREGRLPFDDRAVIQTYLPATLRRNMERNGFRNGASFFKTPEQLVQADCFRIVEPAKWGFFGGYGGSQSIASGRYRTELMNQPEFGANVAFLMLYGSWSADWNLKDSFTKATLASPAGGLGVMSSVHGQWYLEGFALGESLSWSYLRTANGAGGRKQIPRSLAILGDATLRLHVLPPVSGLRGQADGGGVRLSWSVPDATEKDLGCYVYRSGNVFGPYRRISGPLPVAASSFLDASPKPNEAFYLVRRAAEVASPGGRFVNLSQGRFWQRP